MKKIVFALVAIVVAAPAMAGDVDVNAVQVGTTFEVEITYEATSGLPRAFGLDITVDSGQTITDVNKYFAGECDVPGKAKGFGIFPANFARYIDPCDPNWSDPDYTPVADPCDLPGKTEGGIGTSGITIEMGSLYVGPNSPASAGTLCSVWVSGDCTVTLELNVGRAGVVMEDGNAPGSINLYGCTVSTQVSVPDVTAMNKTDATTAIEAVGLVVGVETGVCSEVEAEDEVLTQDPTGGTMADPGSAVDLDISRGGSPLAACGCCLGDVDKNTYIYTSDYIAMIDLMNSFYLGDGSFYRALGHPDYDNNPCADIDKNSYMYTSDYIAMIDLMNALYLEDGSFFRQCPYTPPPGF